MRNRILGLIMAAFCAPEAQADGFYASLLPDSLQPGETYTLNRKYADFSALPGYPSRWPDSVLLKRGGTTLLLVGNGWTDSPYFEYSLTTPLDAALGSYGAYSTLGALREADVALVPDIRKVAPSLAPVPVRGLRGNAYRITARASGLALGPLPAALPAPDSVRYAVLARGKDTLRFREIVIGMPYSFTGAVDIPSDAALGNYSLVVERNDGARTIGEGALEIWLPAKPIVQRVDPDSMVAGETWTLGITGVNMDFAVTAGSDVVLNRAMVKEVHIRNTAGEFLAASAYPNLGTSLQVANINASFQIPSWLPPGKYDLGIIIGGRSDTTYSPDPIRVVLPLAPRFISLDRNWTRRGEFTVFAESRQVTGDFSKAEYSLRGHSVVPGKYGYTSGDRTLLIFSPDSTADTGWYDFHAVFPSGQAYAIARAVYIAGPGIGQPYAAALTQGGYDSLYTRVEAADFPWLIPGATGEPGIRNLLSVRLCRLDQCLDALEAGSPLNTWAWFSRFRVPADFPPGAYDVVVRLRAPDRTFTKPRAVIVAPAGYRAFQPRVSGIQEPYWTARAGFTEYLANSAAAPCLPGEYRLEDGPVGIEYTEGILSWTPTAADTGWNAIRLAGTGACKEKLFLMAHVTPPETETGIRAGRDREAGSVGRAFWRGGRLDLVLREPAAVELRSPSGRLLARLGRLEAGMHGITPPASARGHALILCRLRSSDGDIWLKVPRTP